MQVASSPDSKEMVREVAFTAEIKMVGDNKMQVDHGGHRVIHTAYTECVSIVMASSPNKASRGHIIILLLNHPSLRRGG